MEERNTREIIDAIAGGEKRTPVKVYVSTDAPVDFGASQVFGGAGSYIVFGDWDDLGPILVSNRAHITDCVVECDRRRSAVALLDLKDLPARVEPGAVIRDGAEIGAGAVILMGAVINIGARVGEGTMVDMGAVVGSGAQVGRSCHIGAGAVLSGMAEPACPVPVRVEDGAFIGANAVVLEGVCVGAEAVVAAGAVVTADVPPRAVAAGCPARVVKFRDAGTDAKTALTEALRQL